MTLKTVIKNTLLSCLALSFAACEGVYDNRDNCVNGIQLKFLFDYHMEPGANAFAANVDCVTVYVFDNEGNYLNKYTETSDQLARDNYRMVLPLSEGDYRLMVYGGLSCSHPTFEISTPWSEPSSKGTHHENIIVSLPNENGVSNKKLHDMDLRTGGLFYGFQFRHAANDFDENGRKVWTNTASTPSGIMELSVTNEDFGTTYTEYEVNLMKDTNNIQVILQELDGPYTVDYSDYEFYIYDDNFILDADNVPVSSKDQGFTPTYTPYHLENRIMGYIDGDDLGPTGSKIEKDDSNPVQVGCAEFSTSRLHLINFDSAKLVVKTSKEHDADGNNATIIELPLINYLAATQGMGSSWIRSTQEYLDRQSNWTLYFFLHSGKWIKTDIAVNDWVVRLNNIGNLGGQN